MKRLEVTNTRPIRLNDAGFYAVIILQIRLPKTANFGSISAKFYVLLDTLGCSLNREKSYIWSQFKSL
jgi:hypothetical protein